VGDPFVVVAFDDRPVALRNARENHPFDGMIQPMQTHAELSTEAFASEAFASANRVDVTRRAPPHPRAFARTRLARSPPATFHATRTSRRVLTRRMLINQSHASPSDARSRVSARATHSRAAPASERPMPRARDANDG
jgi:hypothetical protein